jgi:hypothetical protein
MPKVSEIYAGSYLNAADLTPLGQRRRAIVHSAVVEEIGPGARRERKIVLSLTNTKGAAWSKDVVVNRTNAVQLSAELGDDINDWVGKQIEIWAEDVMFQGKMVPGIKIKAAQQGNGAPPPAKPGAVGPVWSGAGDLDDEIPF